MPLLPPILEDERCVSCISSLPARDDARMSARFMLVSRGMTGQGRMGRRRRWASAFMALVPSRSGRSPLSVRRVWRRIIWAVRLVLGALRLVLAASPCRKRLTP
jgi:hypothetical protein